MPEPNTAAPSLTATTALTAEQVAARWQVPKAHVYRLVRDGVIPRGVYLQLGRYVRFNLDALERWERGEWPSDNDDEGRLP